MSQQGFDLVSAARQEMIQRGFDPDFPPGTREQLQSIEQRSAPVAQNGIRDLRQLLWSSIDNDDSRDLDQIEVAERVPAGIRVLVAVADVDQAVEKGSPIDHHAEAQTTTVYTGVRIFPMLPEELSTHLTSLNENEDRLAVVIEFVVAADGAIGSGQIYRALVRNRAQLAYNATGAWLESSAEAPTKVAQSGDLQAQLKLQNEAAEAIRDERHRMGALSFDRVEPQPVFQNGNITGVESREPNAASRLIEDFMIAANEVMARTLAGAHVSSIRRVVKTPERWDRIVDLAAQHGAKLPSEPDSGALNVFLQKQRASDPEHFPDLSLTVIKLMGPGEYVLLRPGDPEQGHFGLAVHDYTHSTAPNRRFADLVTQQLIKS